MQGSSYKWLVLGITSIGTFLSALDGSVINIILPLIRGQYGADIGGISWVPAIYLLVISSLLLTFGRLGDMWGFKYLYSAGYALFGLGSVLCGLAPTLGWLISARAMQGIGAAVLMAIGPALIGVTFPGGERGRALGLQATLTYAGLTIGPSLGGFIAGHWSWHWAFFVNIPITLAGGLLAIACLHPAGDRQPQRFDLAGAALFAAGLTALLLAITRGEAWGWQSPATLGLFAAGLVLLALFLWQERRAAHPMLPLWLFRRRGFPDGVATAFLQYAVIFAGFFLLPLFLTDGRGLTPGQVGLVMTAQPAVMVAFTGIAGWLSDRVGVRGPATVGLVILSLGMWLVSRVGPAGSPTQLMLALGVVGLGAGLFTVPNNSAILGAAPADRQGVASGVLAAARNVGMVIGVATAGSAYAFFQTLLTGRGNAPDQAQSGAFAITLAAAAGVAAVAAVISLARPAPRR